MRSPQPSIKNGLALVALVAGGALAQGCLFPPRWDPPGPLVTETPDAGTVDAAASMDASAPDASAPDASAPETASSSPPDAQPPRDTSGDTADATMVLPDTSTSRDVASPRDVSAPPDEPSSVDDASAPADDAEFDA